MTIIEAGINALAIEKMNELTIPFKKSDIFFCLDVSGKGYTTTFSYAVVELRA